MVLFILIWFSLLSTNVHCINPYQCYELKNLSTDACNQCEFGAECVLTNKNVTCKCIEKCYKYGDDINSRELCADDGNTFPSLCHLQKYSCELKKELKVKYFGKCDPCLGINCNPNQICIVDENRQPICTCDDNCNSTSFQPICASDGHTYYNECTFKVESCKQRRELKILFNGKCEDQNDIESCSNANCEKYELCNIDLNGRSHCNCSSIDCPPVYLPVCADNGRTYDSICNLKKFSCESKKELLVLNYGVCGVHSLNQDHLCDNFSCNFGAACLINSSTLQPFCECEQCSMEYQPVCASDGHTYLNSCLLKRKSCIDQIEINQLYNGVCVGCLSHKCKNYSTCKINQLNQTAECECIFDCQQNETEVCGSDKVIYPNECELKKRSCETNSEIKIVSDISICQLCKQVFCKFGATCYNGKCICPTDCPKLYEPVCSNGLTYINECEFRKSACFNSRDTKTGNLNYDKLDNHTIHVYGDCNRPNSNEEIKSIPVIGKSSILISNHQMIGSYMTMCNENTCKFGGKCFYNENGVPACLCSFDCTATSNEQTDKICGSDGRLYRHECRLMEEACIRQQKIEILPLKNCLINRNYSICNGSLPYFDKASGKSIDCNKKSLFYQECPENYTCLYHRKVIPSIKTLLTFKEQDHFCCLKQNIDQKQFASLNELTINSEQIELQNRCDCNKLGSELPIRCNEKTKQCECKRNVTGLKCNRCQTGYYAFHKLSQGNNGCLPCDCNKNGSLREDCHQTHGHCICKINVSGMKCDVCPSNGKKLTAFGCVDEALLKVHNKKCSSVRCRFGAICKEISPNRSQCVCNLSCRKRFELNYQRRIERDTNLSYSDEYYLNISILKNHKRMHRDKSKYLSRPICGSDQNSHLNECEMRINACRMQRKIVKTKDGQCSSSKELNNLDANNNWQTIVTVTQTSVRRSTLEKEKDQYDLIDEVVSNQTESSLNSNLYIYGEDRSNFNPMFNGRSLIRLSRLESSSFLKFEIELIAFSDKGIIFYNGQSENGQGDFISLTLNNGYFEYRFNLGSGVSTLRSREKVQKSIPTKIVLIKDYKKGFLIINDQDEVSCVAEGNWRSLDLNENFFLGNVKTDYEKIYENLNNVRSGFVGCIMKLELGKNDKELKSIELTNSVLNDNVIKPSKMKIIDYESVGNCSSLDKNKINFCLKYNPCSKHSVCVNLINNTFDCICPAIEKCTVGLLSSKNNQSIAKLELQDTSPPANVYTIDFWGNSYIKSKVLLVNLARAFSIELWFLSRSHNGLLIYAQKNKKSDFLSLNIKDSKLEFIFNLGSRIQNVR